MAALLRSVLDPEDWLVLLIAVFAVGDVHPYRMYTLFLEPGWSFWVFWAIAIPFWIGLGSRIEDGPPETVLRVLNRLTIGIWPPVYLHLLSDGDTGILWFVTAFFWIGCLVSILRYYYFSAKTRSKLKVRLLVLPFALFSFYYASEFLADQFMLPQHRLESLIEFYNAKQYMWMLPHLGEILAWSFLFIIPYSIFVVAPRKLAGMPVDFEVWVKRYILFYGVTAVFAVGRAFWNFYF